VGRSPSIRDRVLLDPDLEDLGVRRHCAHRHVEQAAAPEMGTDPVDRALGGDSRCRGHARLGRGDQPRACPCAGCREPDLPLAAVFGPGRQVGDGDGRVEQAATEPAVETGADASFLRRRGVAEDELGVTRGCPVSALEARLSPQVQTPVG
jgi:DNA-directed RNA polymerase subunit N (RpoN/RPB10)